VRADLEREYVEFVTARLPGLRRLAYLLAGDSHRADDLVQQTCTSLYVHWGTARAADKLDAYVRRMLIRAFVDEWRRAWFRRVDLAGDALDRAAPEPADPTQALVLRQALARVPPRQRAVLVLRFLYDLPVTEVAQILECSPGTVKSQTSHGLAALRRLLGVPAREGTR
jgi:RNA polymerase sigma-70 factor (sigma-E family)